MIDYKNLQQVKESDACDGSMWFELNSCEAYTKYYIRCFWESEKKYTPTFVQVRE